MLKADCSIHRQAPCPILDRHEGTLPGWSPTILQNTSGPLSVGNSSFPSTVLFSLPLALSAGFFPFRFLCHEKFLWHTVPSVPQTPGHTYQSFFATLLLGWDSQYTSRTISHFQISFSLGSFSLVHRLKVSVELASPNLIPYPTLSKSYFRRCSIALWTKRVMGN